ncbi:DUF1631 family protein [Massilia sp. CF038]|uniref:DUF1631 family protein n=1 Tax=Massilia sp. CF038 TaxID=1881045 RepID=UPI00091DC293|nr:DUF1631 family protein [Massilia sp. CF038]SHG69620.1 Protein of unknown function [Massilia sp. CF038]
MASAATSTVNAKKAAVVSQHELLDSLIAIVTKHVNEQLKGVTTRLVASLLDIEDPRLDARQVFQRVKSGNLLKENSYAFIHLASGGLDKALHSAVDELLPRPRKVTSISEANLSLVPFEEMDQRVAFDAISRPFEMKYASQIATLNVRIGFLLNRDILRIAQNPFRPEMFLSVINSAWKEFEPNQEAHSLVAPLLQPTVMWDFGPMYDALCDALISRGQPGSVDSFNIKKTETAKAAKAERAKKQDALAKQLRQFLAGGAESEFGDDIPMIPDLPVISGSGGGWRPSGAEGFGVEAPAEPSQVVQGGSPQHAFAGAPQGAPYTGAPMGQQQGGNGQPSPHHGNHYPDHGAIGAALGQAGYGATQAPLLDMLKALQARMPEQFAATPLAPNSGQALDVFYLPRLKEGLPKGTLSRGDESTIDLLSKVFETVFLDPNIPQETRELIKFLQIPVLKAALSDKNFFFEEAHPARRMIDLLSRMGLEQRSQDDPLFQAMQRSVDRVGREADDSAVFSSAVEELEASIKADESEAVEAIAEPIAVALKQEKVYAATRSAKTAVAARVSSGEVVAVLETFLENKWTSVLTVAYSVEEDKPGAVSSATKTMDDLIWSVKPKITHDERKQLIAKLPGLLATLNKWLDVIKWQEAERLQFFAELAECHASIVRAPLDITPERQLEIAVEVAQEDAKRRLEKETAAAVEPEIEIDEAVLTVETLERGAWLEFTQTDGSLLKAKLAWVSPLKTLFIFSLGARKESFSLSSEKLIAGVRATKVSVVRTDGLVERALSDAMSGGAVNDANAMDVAA